MFGSSHRWLGPTSSTDASHSAPGVSDRFRISRPWRVGYEPEDVDRYIDAITTEQRRLERSQAAAEREIDRLRNYFRNNKIDVA